jgi:predicted Holliday junction resolvase-like endonuclease
LVLKGVFVGLPVILVGLFLLLWVFIWAFDTYSDAAKFRNCQAEIKARIEDLSQEKRYYAEERSRSQEERSRNQNEFQKLKENQDLEYQKRTEELKRARIVLDHVNSVKRKDDLTL